MMQNHVDQLRDQREESTPGSQMGILQSFDNMLLLKDHVRRREGETQSK